MAKITNYTDFFNQFEFVLQSMLEQLNLHLVKFNSDYGHFEMTTYNYGNVPTVVELPLETDEDRDFDTSSRYYILKTGDYEFKGATAESRGNLIINQNCSYVIIDLFDGDIDNDCETGKFIISSNVCDSAIEYHMDFDDEGVKNLMYLNMGESLNEAGEKVIKNIINIINMFMN